MVSPVNQEADLLTQSILDLATRFDKAAEEERETPSDWLEKHYYIPTPRDPVTGTELPSGPIRLADHQRRIIDEALSKDKNGMYNYSTVIYSAPKKSGKSAIASAVALYMAAITPFGQIYCLANDGKNSKDRLYLPIWRCLNFHRQRGLTYKDARINITEAFLGNNAHIEAIPCDASGEAGSEPTGVFYSEFWGYIEENKKRLFTEMTLPPTLYGKAIRWIESYAGFVGVSDLLMDMYTVGVKDGDPHPDFLDLLDDEGNPVVYVNRQAHLFAYWDTVPRMIWQTPEYYQQEAKILSPSEFQRIHRNKWVSPVGGFIHPEWWDACADELLPPLLPGSDVPVVLGVDAAISGDCAAIVGVTRDPRLPDTEVAVRFCYIYKPSPNRVIQIEKDLGRMIRWLNKNYNVVCIAYDAYQMEGMVQNYRRGEVTLAPDEIEGMSPEEAMEYLKTEQAAAQRWYYKFGQQSPRAIADKRLYDMIVARQIHWNPTDQNSAIGPNGNEESLTKHIKQAGSKQDESKMRIEKLAADAKIDAAVAASMAVQRCMTLNLDNRELHAEELTKLLQAGKINYIEFQQRLQAARDLARIDGN